MEEDRIEQITSEEPQADDIPEPFRKRVNGRLDASPSEPGANQPFAIFRVPPRMRERNKECYEPQLVSIGPYHRGKKHLRPMEDHKWKYLRDFLPLEGRWEVLFREMKAIEPRVRSHYTERVNLGPDEFAEMLLLDGCFILEFVDKLMSHREDNFCVPGGILRHIIWNDLFLLENQIPYLVLERLFILSRNVDGRGSSHESLVENRISLARRISSLMNSLIDPVSVSNGECMFDHLVHLCHCCFVLTPQASPSKDRCLCINLVRRCQRPKNLNSLSFSCLFSFLRRSASESLPTIPSPVEIQERGIEFDESILIIPSATELQQSGVTFKKKQCDNFLDITFRPEDGVLEIPSLLIEHSQEYKFTNLVAFEQTRRMDERSLSSYATFMRCLINTPKDATILQQHGIIQNALLNEEAVARFFVDLGDFIVLDPKNNYLSKLFDDVRRYCESNWHKYRALLVDKYFSNPWAFLSLVAAVIFLLLTITQTTFKVISYFHPHP